MLISKTDADIIIMYKGRESTKSKKLYQLMFSVFELHHKVVGEIDQTFATEAGHSLLFLSYKSKPQNLAKM